MAICLAAGWWFDLPVLDPPLFDWEAFEFGKFEPAVQAASAGLCVRSLAAAKSIQ
jgi:hypothetical protein